MKNYKVENCGGWFVIRTNNKCAAKKFGIAEYGKGHSVVTEASASDVAYYESQRGKLREEYWTED